MENREIKISRNLTLDGLRAIAAMSVFTHHLCGGFSGQFGNLGTVGVILFFLISGYCIVLSLNNLGSRPSLSFLVRRVFRLYPAYWLAVIFAAVVSQEPVTSEQFLLNLTMLQRIVAVPDINGVFWTLFLELVFYGFMIIFLIWAGDAVYQRTLYRWMLFILIVTAFLAALVRYLTNLSVPFGHLMFLSVFFMGALVGMTYLKKKEMMGVYCLAFGYLILVYCIARLICVDGNQVDFSHNFFNYLWPFLLFFIALNKQWFSLEVVILFRKNKLLYLFISQSNSLGI